MAIGSLVAAIPLSSNRALIGQSYNDSVDMQDTTDVKPVDVLVRDSYEPQALNASALRGRRGFQTSFDPNPTSLGNKRVRSFYDIFYNRIHYDPAVMRLGQLLNAQTRDLLVWNAYFSQRTLISVVGTDDDGLSLGIGSVPQVYQPLQQTIYPLSVSVDGPPTINASYEFTWDNQVNTYLVTGERLVVFAFPPDPSTDFTERLKWYGTTNAAYSGKEQRMSLSELPKVSYNYRVQVMDNELQRFDAIMWGWQNRSFAVPVWNSYTYTSQAIGQGTTTLFVEDTANREFAVDRVAILFAGPELYEAVEIQEVQADRLILKKPVQASWTRKVAVLPARTMRMAKDISYTGPVANFREIDMSFTAEAGEDLTVIPWTATYKGLPVMEFSPDMSGGLSGSYSRNADWEDGEYSLPLIYDHSGLGTPKQTWQFAWADYGEIQQFKSLLRSLYGTTRPFWISTWSPDLTMAAPIELNSAAMYVEESLQVNMYFNRKGRSDIVIRLRDGTIYYRGILSVTPGSGVVPNSELFVLDEPIPRRILPNQVACISYLTQSRFENEAFEFVWKAQDFATMSAMIKGLTDGI